MNLPASVANANLPQNYERAKTALAECASIDECKEWADKAAALASYAKQADDKTLQKYAERVRARAANRTGELLKQIEPAPTGPKPQLKAGDRLQLGRAGAAREAGMSPHQAKQAVRIASVPREDFERQVEGDNPPTLSQLASQGVKKREPIIDLEGRDPKEYNRALHYVGDFEQAARDLSGLRHDTVLPTLDEKERARLRAAIQKIDAITDKVATRI